MLVEVVLSILNQISIVIAVGSYEVRDELIGTLTVGYKDDVFKKYSPTQVVPDFL